MESVHSEKSSSSASKLSISKAHISIDGKQKKSRRKKKNKKSSRSNSVKSDIESVKHAVGEREHAQENDEVEESRGNYQYTRDTSSTVTQAVKLPLLVRGSLVPTFTDVHSPSYISTGKQTCSNLEVNSLLPQFNNIHVKQKLPSKSKLQCNNSANKQNDTKQYHTNADKDIFKIMPTNMGPSISSNLDTENSRQLYSNVMNTNNNNESLRWECVLEDSEEELERIRVYKINRRKRYLAAAYAKGLSWAVSHNITTSFQFCDDIGLASLKASSSSYVDYRPLRNLGISQTHNKFVTSAVKI